MAPPRPYRGRGVRGAGAGEIVEVQGGHILRSTGRKDRHSKVCTAKGPRDRRVRLSAHTAIQFYDVQDRLGYDRPSKAVDWLIKHAKAAIDELAELPPWRPSVGSQSLESAVAEEAGEKLGPSVEQVGYGFGSADAPNFLPQALDSDAIADTIKSFFPLPSAPAVSSSSRSVGFPSYSTDLTQDLRLSLQSFQDPTFHHSEHHQESHDALLSGTGHITFDERMVPWNTGGGGGGGGSGVYVFNVAPPPPHLVLGQAQVFTQRGTLQSSNSPCAWADPVVAAAAAAGDRQVHPANIGFASGSRSSVFGIPAGEEEHCRGISDKPPSASRH